MSHCGRRCRRSAYRDVALGRAIEAAHELLPTLRHALDDEAVSVIACPVDYAENAKLVEALGALTDPIG